MRAVLGGILCLGGIAFLLVWFGTRNMMIREGTWAEQGGAGAYLWLAIYVGMIVAGFLLATSS